MTGEGERFDAEFRHAGVAVGDGDVTGDEIAIAAGFDGKATSSMFAFANNVGHATAGELAVSMFGPSEATDEMGWAISRHGRATSHRNGLSVASDEDEESISGVGGTAIAGWWGSVRAGEGGIIAQFWWDETSKRKRLAVAYVGEEGIEPDTAYAFCPETRRFVEVTPWPANSTTAT